MEECRCKEGWVSEVVVVEGGDIMEVGTQDSVLEVEEEEGVEVSFLSFPLLQSRESAGLTRNR